MSPQHGTDVEPSGNHRHLVLVGLMGAGKTTVGRRCAALLDRAFVDTDELIAVTAHRSIPEIFEAEGEEAFRRYERDAVVDACASPTPLVIACGGGAVLDADNRRRLRSAGVVVWLRASPSVLGERVRGGVGRPLLAEGSPVTTLERLLVQRSPAYEAAAHLVVDTEGEDVDEVARHVVKEVAAWNG